MVKKSGAALTDRHYVLRDTVGEYFKIGQNIDYVHYVGDDSILATMRVRDILSDGPLPETDTLLRYRVTYLVEYLELIEY